MTVTVPGFITHTACLFHTNCHQASNNHGIALIAQYCDTGCWRFVFVRSPMQQTPSFSRTWLNIVMTRRDHCVFPPKKNMFVTSRLTLVIIPRTTESRLSARARATEHRINTEWLQICRMKQRLIANEVCQSRGTCLVLRTD